MIRKVLIWVLISSVSFIGGAAFENWWTDNQREYINLLPSNDRPPAKDDYILPTRYLNLVIHWTDETGMPIWLMSRLWDTESWWNPHATNGHARGLGQLMDENKDFFSRMYFNGKPFDPYDPADAIQISTQYLRDLVAFTGDWGRGIGAYNAGPYKPPERWKRETVNYVQEIWERP